MQSHRAIKLVTAGLAAAHQIGLSAHRCQAQLRRRGHRGRGANPIAHVLQAIDEPLDLIEYNRWNVILPEGEFLTEVLPDPACLRAWTCLKYLLFKPLIWGTVNVLSEQVLKTLEYIFELACHFDYQCGCSRSLSMWLSRNQPCDRRQIGNSQFEDVLRQVSPSGIADWQVCCRVLAGLSCPALSS